MWEKADKDRSGYLTKAECIGALKMLGKHMDDAGVDRVMQIMDKSNDGDISFSGMVYIHIFED